MKITTRIFIAKKEDVSLYENMSIPVPDSIYDMSKELIFELGRVESIAESLSGDEINPKESVIYMVSGESFTIATPYAELKELFLSHKT